MQGPSRVVFTEHAADRAARYDIPYTEAADAILELHHRRARNPGAGGWLVRRGRLAIVYDWPDQDDGATARVVTLWVGE